VNKNGSVWQQYYYDALGQLRRANDIYIYQSLFYTYDVGGNLTKIKRYYYNEGDYALGAGDFMNEDNFTYATTGWKDKLESFNSKAITYDTAGNPLTYGTWEMEWTAGRQLKRVDSNVTTKGSLDFTYNENGLRTSKTLVYTNNGIENTEITKYDWIDGKLMSQSKPYMTLFFFYDGDELVGCSDGTNSYVYEKNLQGDVLGLIDNTGAKVVEYKYSPYGDTLRTYAAENSWDLAYANPFRYRSYIQDSDFTGWYYCQSRYYVPQWGRFLNADTTDVLDIEGKITGTNNLFAYCGNNSVNDSDQTGTLAANIVAAVVSALISVLIEILYQGFSNWLKKGRLVGFTLDWRSIGIVAVSGFASGLLMASKYKRIISAVGSGVIAAASHIVDKIAHKRKINWLSLLIDVGVATIIGATSKGVGSKYYKNCFNTKGGLYHYTYKGTHFATRSLIMCKPVFKDFVKEFSIFASTTIGDYIQKFLRERLKWA
jgi:RHS repeat-associated protein